MSILSFWTTKSQILLLCFLLSVFLYSCFGFASYNVTIPFDAAHRGGVAQGKFFVSDTRQVYMFNMEFDLENGPETSKFLNKLGAEYSIYLADSYGTDNPIKVMPEDFREKTVYANKQEENDDLNNMMGKYHSIYYGHSTEEEKKKYLVVQNNKENIVQVIFDIYKIEDGNEKKLIVHKFENTTGFRGGGGPGGRSITNFIFKESGFYEVRVEALRDTPFMYNVPINLGIHYYPFR